MKHKETSKNLGDILIEQGIINRDDLEHALQLQGRRLGEILIQEKLADPVAVANALKFQAKESTDKRSQRIGLEAQNLDDFLYRLEAIENLLLKETPTPSSALHSLVSLRESIERVLLEPIETLFKKAKLVAAEAASARRKKVQLTFEGGELIIDRSLVSDLSDIMLHLVRNAIDHGIEPAQSRLAAGKSETANLKLSITHHGGELILTIADDGAGIDIDKVYSKAKKEGLTTKEISELSDQNIFQFLFTAGFSTAEAVTSTSGRGVGLDVVEATVLRLGGKVEVKSEAALGATFTIRVPLSYAKFSVLPLRIGKEWIVVNAAEVASIEQSTDVSGLLSAASLFSAKNNEPHVFRLPVLVVSSASGSRWAFDEVGQSEDALVREASAFALSQHGVVGGTRLKSGKDALVVDLGILSQNASPALVS